jgi:AcrR family transcriptional regulator
VAVSTQRGRLTADARREAILEAARPVFGGRGYHAATTREIAAAAGVSEALLYQHFPGKSDLFLAVVERCAADLEARLKSALEGDDPLGGAVRAYFDFVAEEADLYRIFFRQALQEEAFQRLYRRYSARLLELFTEGLGRERSPRTEVLGRALAGMVGELALWWVEERAQEREGIIEQAVRMARAMHSSEVGDGSSAADR